jgi:hypothetical protein
VNVVQAAKHSDLRQIAQRRKSQLALRQRGGAKRIEQHAAAQVAQQKRRAPPAHHRLAISLE